MLPFCMYLNGNVALRRQRAPGISYRFYFFRLVEGQNVLILIIVASVREGGFRSKAEGQDGKPCKRFLSGL